MWRYRDAPLRAGLALGVAVGIKFLLWPLGLWLVATRRTGAAIVALVGRRRLVASDPAVHRDRRLPPIGAGGRAATFDQDSYSTVRRTRPPRCRRLRRAVVTFAWARAPDRPDVATPELHARDRAALVLSPIIWQDFFALAAIPLAIVRPRLSVVWFLPLLTWGATSSGIAIGLWNVVRLLVVFSVVLLVAARAERSGPAP